MRKIILASLLILTGQALCQLRTHYKRALFIGNSYTYFNNLPQMVADIARSNGDTLFFDSNSIGGYSFQNHCQDLTTKNKISAGNWNYVIVQAQSQEPSFSIPQVNAQTLPYAIRLDSMIDASPNCAMTVFYETWGRKNGDAGNCPFFPPICTYTGMQNRLRDSYKMFTDTCKALMAPVGEAWRASITASASLELYQTDESHPINPGTYLAAAVIYETFFKRSVLTASFDPGLGTGIMPFLRQIAHNTVHDSLNQWRHGVSAPWSGFTSTMQNPSTVGFMGVSPGIGNMWYFGDGSTSSQTSPIHTYTASGTYTVSHVTFKDCFKDSTTASITVTVASSVNTGIKKEMEVRPLVLFPNPCTNEIFLTEHLQKESLILTDVLGKQHPVILQNNILNTSDLAPGLYTLLSFANENYLLGKFIKE